MIDVVMLTVVGVLMALAIGLVVKYFGAKADPLAEKLGELMPGANCGGCGFAGCGDYANAMATGKAKPGNCPSMSDDTLKKICELLGVQAEKGEPKVAVVCCSGDDHHTTRVAFYNGVNDCLNAMMVAGGAKGCTYGCLGLGSCARACPFGAIEILPTHVSIRIFAKAAESAFPCVLAKLSNWFRARPRRSMCTAIRPKRRPSRRRYAPAAASAAANA